MSYCLTQTEVTELPIKELKLRFHYNTFQALSVVVILVILTLFLYFIGLQLSGSLNYGFTKFQCQIQYQLIMQ